MEAAARRAGPGEGEQDGLLPAPASHAIVDSGDEEQQQQQQQAAAAAAVLRELEAAAAGLVVVSECDAPFSTFEWPEPVIAFSPAALAVWCGGSGKSDNDGGDADADEEPPGNPNYAVEPVAAWFERAARALGPEDASTARLKQLGELMQRRLRGAVAVRVGAVARGDDDDPAGRIRVFLAGRVVAEGEQAEEDDDELGVFPAGAKVVGLETLQVET